MLFGEDDTYGRHREISRANSLILMSHVGEAAEVNRGGMTLLSVRREVTPVASQ